MAKSVNDFILDDLPQEVMDNMVEKIAALYKVSIATLKRELTAAAVKMRFSNIFQRYPGIASTPEGRMSETYKLVLEDALKLLEESPKEAISILTGLAMVILDTFQSIIENVDKGGK